MNKKGIAKEVASILGVNQNDIIQILDKIFEIIVKNLVEGNDVLISKFGKFRIKKVNDKKARNPKTGEEIFVKGGYKILFKVSDVLKGYINSDQIKIKK